MGNICGALGVIRDSLQFYLDDTFIFCCVLFNYLNYESVMQLQHIMFCITFCSVQAALNITCTPTCQIFIAKKVAPTLV